jgi:hypothetical protein
MIYFNNSLFTNIVCAYLNNTLIEYCSFIQKTLENYILDLHIQTFFIYLLPTNCLFYFESNN